MYNIAKLLLMTPTIFFASPWTERKDYAFDSVDWMKLWKNYLGPHVFGNFANTPWCRTLSAKPCQTWTRIIFPCRVHPTLIPHGNSNWRRVTPSQQTVYTMGTWRGEGSSLCCSMKRQEMQANHVSSPLLIQSWTLIIFTLYSSISFGFWTVCSISLISYTSTVWIIQIFRNWHGW